MHFGTSEASIPPSTDSARPLAMTARMRDSMSSSREQGDSISQKCTYGDNHARPAIYLQKLVHQLTSSFRQAEIRRQSERLDSDQELDTGLQRGRQIQRRKQAQHDSDSEISPWYARGGRTIKPSRFACRLKCGLHFRDDMSTQSSGTVSATEFATLTSEFAAARCSIVLQCQPHHRHPCESQDNTEV